MKVVILAGGIGSRLTEETEIRPKPMVEIGHRPILWHIMQHYSHYGFSEFVICLGYKGEYIKKYFSDTLAMASDLTIDFATHSVEMLETARDDWRVTLIDTGQTTQTAGRLERVRKHVGDETFLMTYGDGVSDVNLHDLVEFHRRNGKLATITAVHPPARFGKLHIEGSMVTEFEEKPQMSEGWINGGFFVLEPGIFDYIPGDVDWAHEPLEHLARDGQLAGYATRLLAVHGHDARQDPAQLPVGQWRRALEALELVTASPVLETAIDGVVVFTPTPIRDERGFFSRTLDLAWCVARGLETAFVQHNQSRSSPRRAARLARAHWSQRGEAGSLRQGEDRRSRRRHAAVVADLPAHGASRARRRAAAPPVPAAVRGARVPGRVRRRRRVLPPLTAVRSGHRPFYRVE